MNDNQRRTAEGILFTDQYQLTMAQLYFRMGLHEKTAQFDHLFRSNPDYGSHQAGFCVNAGLEWLLQWMREVRFTDQDLEYLANQEGLSGRPIFDRDFLEWLRENGSFEAVSLKAVPEGRVVHPNVPVTTVQGPLAMTQILETPLLNYLNYQTLIATKASRINYSSQGGTIMEFGLRRAQGKGGNAGVRGALIGGVDFSSNVGISHVLGYPPKGTHAHSMVQVFLSLYGSELEAFRAYAEVYPDDCLLLVDTVNTLDSGVPNAIKVFEELKSKGRHPLGVRLDSGDLAYLAIQSARMLNDAGFPDVKIVLSNQLDELVIWQIISQIREEAARYGVDPDHLIKRLIYGVGTRLITSKGAAALDGVYKLVAVEKKGELVPAIKISESPAKTLNPGQKQIWRLYDSRDKSTADLIAMNQENPGKEASLSLHHPIDHSKKRRLETGNLTKIEPLMKEILKEGELVYDLPDIEEMREIRTHDVEKLDAGVKRLINPHIYHVSLSEQLWDLKQRLISETTEYQTENKEKNNGGLS
ncbi:MAG: nicotinate phosphoribosyltransferase [Desulfurivibrionaceae bacterium]